MFSVIWLLNPPPEGWFLQYVLFWIMRLGLDQSAWVRLLAIPTAWFLVLVKVFISLCFSSHTFQTSQSQQVKSCWQLWIGCSLPMLITEVLKYRSFHQGHQNLPYPCYRKKVTLRTPHSILLCASAFASAYLLKLLPKGTLWSISWQSWISYKLKFSFFLSLHISVASPLLPMYQILLQLLQFGMVS